MQRFVNHPMPDLEEEVRKHLFVSNPYYIALVEASNANPSALERVNVIEQDPDYAAFAWEVRLVTHLYAGRFKQAIKCLREKELLAIQNPEYDILLTSGLIFEAWAYGMSGDLMGLKRVLVAVTKQAESYPGWVPVMLVVRGNHYLLRGELDKAHRDLEEMMRIAPIGQHFAWHRGIPVLVETLLEMKAFEKAREVAAQSLETAETICSYPEAVRELHRVLALADAKLDNTEQAIERIEATIDRARTEKVGDVPLGILYETAARIAIHRNDIDRFITYAKAVADIYGPGKNRALIAKYAQLMMDAERSHLPGQWRIQTPFETHFLGNETATRALQLVHTTMSKCTTIEQGYKTALELLVQLTDATYGYIYTITREGLRLMAPIERESAPAKLGYQLSDFFDSWNADRTGQQLETQTLASRTLTGAGIAKKNTVFANDDGAFQPLVLWVENEEQPEVVCVAALSVAELPLEDLLWPFTNVIAHYLLKLRI